MKLSSQVVYQVLSCKMFKKCDNSKPTNAFIVFNEYFFNIYRVSTKNFTLAF